jgi:hypothetical protein
VNGANREPRTEVVSVRLTAAERARLDAMGGPTEVLRRALQPQPLQCVVPTTTSGFIPGTYLWISGVGCDTGVVWGDGTVGPFWPALASG